MVPRRLRAGKTWRAFAPSLEGPAVAFSIRGFEWPRQLGRLFRPWADSTWGPPFVSPLDLQPNALSRNDPRPGPDGRDWPGRIDSGPGCFEGWLWHNVNGPRPGRFMLASCRASRKQTETRMAVSMLPSHGFRAPLSAASVPREPDPECRRMFGRCRSGGKIRTSRAPCRATGIDGRGGP
jgi:hypothetical protein